MYFARQQQKLRTAFTLVEILVVIAIIGVLTVITVGAVLKVTGGTRVSATRTVIATIDRTLHKHWAAVIAEAKAETGLATVTPSVPVPPNTAINNVFFGGAGDPTGGDLTRLIWIKMRLMEAYPVSYAEITSNTPATGGLKWLPTSTLFPYKYNIIPPSMQKYNATYSKALKGRVNDNKGGVTESSACLLLALSTVTRDGTTLKLEDLGSSYVGDSDADGVAEFLDAWGNPLSFYRFPSLNWRLQNTCPATTNPINPMSPDPKDLNLYQAKSPYLDPLDPKGLLFRWTANGRFVFENNVHRVSFNNSTAAYVVPTIVSWGPDGDINKVDSFGNPYGSGLDNNKQMIPQLMAITDFNDPNYDFQRQETDNIYSFSLR